MSDKTPLTTTSFFFRRLADAMAAASEPRKHTKAQEFILGLLAIAPLTLSELTYNMPNFERSYIYRSLVGLIEEGFIVSLPPKNGGRRVIYALSPKAMQYERDMQDRSDIYLVRFARLIAELRKSTLN